MTIEALDIYRTHLNEQLGEDSPISESAVFDPSGAEEAILSGVFDNTTMRGPKDAAHVGQKKTSARFILSEMFVFDVYEGKEIFLPYREKTYKIDYIDKDKTGAQVLWLY